jgi:hypothetical protein
LELTRTLAAEIEAKDHSLGTFRDRPNEQIIQLYRELFGLKRLRTALKRELTKRDVKPTQMHQLLADSPWTTIVTTNWDYLIETAFRNAGSHVAVVRSEQDFSNRVGADVVVVKLHGDLEDPSTLVAAESDYLGFDRKHPLLSAWIVSRALDNDFLFLGYSFRDFHIKSLVARLDLQTPGRGRFFVLCAEPDKSQSDYLRSLGMRPIQALAPKSGTPADRTLRFIRGLHAQTHLVARRPDTILSLLLRENRLYLASLRKTSETGPRIIRNQSSMAVFGSPEPDSSVPLFTGKWESTVGVALDCLERNLFECWMKAIARGVNIKVIISLLPEAYAKYSQEQLDRRLTHFKYVLTHEIWDNPHVIIVVKDATVERKLTIFDSEVLVTIERGLSPMPVATSCRVTLHKGRIYAALNQFDAEFTQLLSQNLALAGAVGVHGIDTQDTLRKYVLYKLDLLMKMGRKKPDSV